VSILEQTALPTGAWTADPAHTLVEFAARHMGLATVRGRATRVSGSLLDGQLEGEVEAAGITTHDPDRDAHLASPDFFDTDRHPLLRLVTTDIRRSGDELLAQAELTIKGITRPVELRGRVTGEGVDPWGKHRLGIDLAGTIDRSEFGLRWNAPLPGGGFLLDDEVRLELSISLVKDS
jgi:polyisoprenoid-binding protein YceI